MDPSAPASPPPSKTLYRVWLTSLAIIGGGYFILALPKSYHATVIGRPFVWLLLIIGACLYAAAFVAFICTSAIRLMRWHLDRRASMKSGVPRPLLAEFRRTFLTYSLRSGLILVTVLMTLLGLHANDVRKRRTERARIVKEGGSVLLYGDIEPGTPFAAQADAHKRYYSEWRTRIGDEAVFEIVVPGRASEAARNRLRTLFPEAFVDFPDEPEDVKGVY